jgi:hypothetical protein
LAFLTQNKAKLCKILIITLVFEKNAISFAENCRKSPKIVITTSTPGPAFSKLVLAGGRRGPEALNTVEVVNIDPASPNMTW